MYVRESQLSKLEGVPPPCRVFGPAFKEAAADSYFISVLTSTYFHCLLRHVEQLTD